MEFYKLFHEIHRRTDWYSLYSWQCKAILSKNQDMIKDLMETARLGNDSVSTNEVRRLFHKKGYEGRKRLYEIQ